MMGLLRCGFNVAIKELNIVESALLLARLKSQICNGCRRRSVVRPDVISRKLSIGKGKGKGKVDLL